MSNLRRRPDEIDQKQELANVLQQIEAVTGIKPGSDVVESPKIVAPEPATQTAKELPQVPTPAPTMAQISEPQPPVINYHKAGEINVYDVVQVVNSQNKNYGVIFIVGDVKGSTVHGFYITGETRQFVTVEISDIKNDKACGILGEAIVKSKKPCSEEWINKYGIPNQAT